MIVGCSLKFIDSDSTLRNILQASRDFNEVLSRPVYKQALLATEQHRLPVKRRSLWLKLLEIDPGFIQGEFEAYQ